MPTYLFDINPVPASRPRVSKYGTYYLATYRDFKDKMRQLIAQAPHLYKKYEGLLKVKVTCSVKQPGKTIRLSPSGDVDNYAKAVLDSLNGVLWVDDDQIINLTVSKEFDSEGSIRVEVTPVKQRIIKTAVSQVRVKRTGSKLRQSRGVRRRA